MEMHTQVVEQWNVLLWSMQLSDILSTLTWLFREFKLLINTLQMMLNAGLIILVMENISWNAGCLLLGSILLSSQTNTGHTSWGRLEFKVDVHTQPTADFIQWTLTKGRSPNPMDATCTCLISTSTVVSLVVCSLRLMWVLRISTVTLLLQLPSTVSSCPSHPLLLGRSLLSLKCVGNPFLGALWSWTLLPTQYPSSRNSRSSRLTLWKTTVLGTRPPSPWVGRMFWKVQSRSYMIITSITSFV